MAMQRPDIYHGVAFAADPNDAMAVPSWTPFDGVSGAPVVLGWDRNARGRQYELARTMGADPKMLFRDVNEWLNPDNPSSPYYPFVQPYRPSLTMATWPHSPTANNNLFNLTNWRVPIDPGFESYAVGSTPAFLTGWTTSGADPLVSTANPQQGVNSLQYGVPTDATGTRYGVQWRARCVPGTQYTASAYVRQTSASTQTIRITDQTLVNDPFNRSSASTWTTAPTGGTWASVNGTAAERTVSPATPYSTGGATAAINNLNTNYIQYVGGSLRDVRVRARITVPAVAVGGAIQAGLIARYTGPGDTYEALAIFGTDRSVTLRLDKRVGGAFTILDTQRLEGIAYSAGDQFDFDLSVVASQLRAACVRTGAVAPDALTAPDVQATDTAIPGTGAVGTFYWVDPSNTNSLPIAIRLEQFSAVGAVEGTTTAATLAYNRVSVTFTATQPVHTVTVSTTAGTALAGTVNVDSIMHNVGATAGTWQSTGSSVYPVMRPFVERWTRTWQSMGNEGYSDVPCVDALAALNAINVPAPYAGFVRKLRPDFWWRLDGGDGTTVFPDISGNGGPSLGLNISKYGIGTLPRGGASMDIPGGGGVTGVTFTPPNPNTGSTQAGTSLGTGPLSENKPQPFVLPAVISASEIWRVTVAMWVRATNSGTGQTAFYPSRQLSATAGAAYIPCYVDIDGGTGTALTNVSATGTIHVLTSGDGLSGIDLLDGEPHLLVGITVQDPTGDTYVFRFVDDELDGVNTATTASLGGVLRGQTNSLSVGATDDGARYLATVNGSISELMVFNRELSATELTQLYQAGMGHPGDTVGQRLARDLELAGYTGETRISDDYPSPTPGDPVTTLQAPSWSTPYTALADLLALTEAEQGCSWVAPDGAIVLEGRADRFYRLTNSWTLGEDEAGGEAPYLEGVTFDYDPAFVYANVSVARLGGGSFAGGLGPDVAAAARRFFPRSFGLSADFADDDQAQDTADWIFYGHRAPGLRVSAIELDPASNPDLWPLVLGVEIGDRLRVRRRVRAANSGAGLDMDADFFVENVTHHGIDYATGQWYTTLLLSPVGQGPGITVQPWILDDTTLSVLGSTTILGF